MNTIKQRFKDSMDPTRILEVVRYQGQHAVCKVFFREGGARPTPAGITLIPINLLVAEEDRKKEFRQQTRIGFLPILQKKVMASPSV